MVAAAINPAEQVTLVVKMPPAKTSCIAIQISIPASLIKPAPPHFSQLLGNNRDTLGFPNQAPFLLTSTHPCGIFISSSLSPKRLYFLEKYIEVSEKVGQLEFSKA